MARDEALLRLAGLWPGTRLTVIGAAGLELQGSPIGANRSTMDVDLAVDRDQEAIDAVMAVAAGWKPDPRQPQRWLDPEGWPIDLIPASSELVSRGFITWPVGEKTLSLIGFRHLGRSEGTLFLPQFGLYVALPHVVVLLKIVAWTDRPHERGKDLADIAAIVNRYLPDEEDRLYLGEASRLDIYGEDAQAWLLGFDIGRCVDDAERGVVDSFLSRLANPNDSLATAVALRAPSSWHRDEDEVRRRFRVFDAGLHQGRTGSTP